MYKTISVVLLLTLAVAILAACGGGGAAPAAPFGDVAKGKEVFTGTCVSCHGPDAKGIEGLGKDMTVSAFIAEQTPEQLLAFVKTGRAASDPANTTGVDMPPKGGNPVLTEENLKDVVAFMKSINTVQK